MRFCPLYSGSSGNSSFIESGPVRLLVDAGLPGSRIISALRSIGVEPESINGILVTHDHSDHVAGVGILARKLHIPIYANAATWRAMAGALGPVPPEQTRVFETGRDFFIGPLNILPCPASHDGADPVGYVFTDGAKKLTVITDTGCFGADLVCAAAGSDLVLIESNHDIEMLKVGRYPYPLKMRILGAFGHLSNDACGEALVKLYTTGVRRAILAHLSQDNNIESLAYETVRAILRASDIPDEAFALSIAHRDAPGAVLEV